jgi:hypothetical protein
MRDDCVFDTAPPNFNPIACCDTLKTDETPFTLDDKANGLCSDDKSICKEPKTCCANSNPFNVSQNTCYDENKVLTDDEKNVILRKIREQNCDNLANCTKPSPFCIPGLYEVDRNFLFLWNNKVKKCGPANGINFRPFLCSNSNMLSVLRSNPTKKIEGTDITNFFDRCLPKLPCCTDEMSPSTYPCHNFDGCVPQYKYFCCTKKYFTNCQDSHLNEDNTVKFGITQPTIIKCKPPIPCCDGKLDSSQCIEPDNSANPSNCTTRRRLASIMRWRA